MGFAEARHFWLFRPLQRDLERWRSVLTPSNGQATRWFAADGGSEVNEGDGIFFVGTNGTIDGIGYVQAQPSRTKPADLIGHILYVDEITWASGGLTADVLNPRGVEPPHLDMAAGAIRKAPAGAAFNEIVSLLLSTQTNQQNVQLAAQRIPDDVLRQLGSPPSTKLARRILERAGEVNAGHGLLSSTRLLLGAVDVALKLPATDGSPEEDAAAVRAFGSVVQKFARAFEALRYDYQTKSAHGAQTGSGELTQNGAQILFNAVRRDGAVARLSARGIIDVLLEDRETNHVKRLQEHVAPVSVLRKEYQVALADTEVTVLVGTKSSAYQPVAWTGNDNPWALGLVDRLGAHAEASAFAALAISPDLKPPLAVGVFGNWGAGKSFFLRLVHEKIERLASQSFREGSVSFVQQIAQIRFNAWHYVDSNLWPSLVDHIFTQLDFALRDDVTDRQSALFESLSTARQLTVEAAQRLASMRQEQKLAAARLLESQTALEKARSSAARSPAVFWGAVQMELIGALKSEQASIDEAAEKLGLRDAAKDAKLLNDAVQELKSESGKAKAFSIGLRNQIGSWPVMLLFVALICAIPVAMEAVKELLRVVLPQFDSMWQTINYITTSIGGVFVASAAALGWATRRVRAAISTIEKAGVALETAIQTAVQAEAEQTDLARSEVSKATAAVEESRALFASSTERLTEANREYNASSGRARLLQFVREQVQGQKYSRQTGLIAAIRRDFEELAAAMVPTQDAARSEVSASESAEVLALADRLENGELLTKEEADRLRAGAIPNAASTGKTVDRIILYIDDLDRCPPDKVAEVLQAIHLLLSFPLFVVFVAVDVRWVNEALVRQYPMLQPRLPAPEVEKGSLASPHDYLEKIFQVPYWVRPMSSEASLSLLQDRIQRHRPRDATIRGVDMREHYDAILPSEGSTSTQVKPQTNAKGEGEVAAEAVPSSTELARHLEISEEESAFMLKLAPYAGSSPRRMLRFLNVVQVIKAAKLAGDSDSFTLGTSYAILLCVAISTGAPSLYTSFQQWLQKQARDVPLDASQYDRLSGELVALSEAEAQSLTGAVREYLALESGVKVATLLQYALLVSRFTFDGARCQAMDS